LADRLRSRVAAITAADGGVDSVPINAFNRTARAFAFTLSMSPFLSESKGTALSR